MTIEVISTTASRSFDLVFGIVKNPNEEDQYTAVIAMYPPNTIQKASKGEIMVEIGRYMVETGSLDEISKYTEVGIFSEWPRLRTFYSINQNYDQLRLFGEMSDRDLEYGMWVEKRLKEHVPEPEIEAEHRKKKWWKRLLGMK